MYRVGRRVVITHNNIIMTLRYCLCRFMFIDYNFFFFSKYDDERFSRPQSKNLNRKTVQRLTKETAWWRRSHGFGRVTGLER